jgi:UPF0176 protein
MIVLGFYKYVEIKDGKKLAASLKDFCSNGDYKGSFWIGTEGINASVSGTRKEIDKLKTELEKHPKLKDLFYKEETSQTGHPFKKMKVRFRNEIVGFKAPVNLKNAGKHISGEQLIELYDENGKLKKNVILLDTRNDYEYRVGKFKDAIHLDLKTFREFPEKIKGLDSLKDKKIVTYCTGGIRCEKASAYMKEQGFKNVSQLNQGIIQFTKEHPDSIWEGKCFVFDKRLTSKGKGNTEPISDCYICGKKCDFLRNCRNKACNRFYVSCIDCEKEYSKCCSKSCSKIYKTTVTKHISNFSNPYIANPSS